MTDFFPIKRAQQVVIIWMKELIENTKFKSNQFAEEILSLAHPRQ